MSNIDADLLMYACDPIAVRRFAAFLRVPVEGVLNLERCTEIADAHEEALAVQVLADVPRSPVGRKQRRRS